MEVKDKQSAQSDDKTMKLMRWGINAAIALVIGAAAYLLLPFGVSIAENAFQMSLALSKTALVAIPTAMALSTLWASRALFTRWQERFVGGLWERFIYNDPVKYIEEEVIGFEKERRVVQGARTQLREVYDSLTSMGDALVSEAKTKFTEAEAVEATDATQAGLYASFAQEKLNSVDDIRESAAEVEDSITVMEEIDHYLDMNIQQMKHDLEMMRLEMKLQMVKSQAADSVRSIIQGNPDQRARLQMAQRAYREKVSKYSANYKSMMADVEPLIKSKRIAEVIATTEGKKALQKFKENKDSLFGLKDFRTQLNEVAQQLGKNDPGYKPDLKDVQKQSANPLTRRSTTKFGDLN